MLIDPKNFEAKELAIEEFANKYDKKYSEHLDKLRSAKLFVEANREFAAYDAYVVGTMFEQYKAFEAWMKETGSVSDLGALPNIALDVITASYGLGVQSLLTSQQPMADQIGLVWYKNVNFSDTRKGVNAGDTWINSQSHDGSKTGLMDAYAGSGVPAEVLGSTVSGTLTYNLSANIAPLRPHLSSITIEGTTLQAIETGTGVLFGNGIDGEIDYANGDITLNFRENPGTVANNIILNYQQDFEKSADIPEIDTEFTTKSVTAQVYALKQKSGRLQTFSYNKQFGKMLEDEMINDLSQGIAASASNQSINAYVAGEAVNGITSLEFDVSGALGVGITKRDRELDLELVVDEADGELNANAGRGGINRMIAGTLACTYLSHQKGFVRAAVGNNFGPHLYGTWKGITIVRAPQIDSKTTLCGYVSPVSPFEAAASRGIYMPLFMTGFLPDGQNPLVRQRAVAEWVAYSSLVPKFTHKIVIKTA